MTMTWNDLNQSLLQTLSIGQIGTPVALRMHLQFRDENVDPIEKIAAVLEAAHGIFGGALHRLMARDGAGCQITVLANYESGETLFVTVGTGLSPQSTVQLLLIGNHGVANLDGSEWDGVVAEPTKIAMQRWRELLRASLNAREPVLLADC